MIYSKKTKTIFFISAFLGIISSCVTSEVHKKENVRNEPDENFYERLETVKIKITASPRETIAEKPFSSPYEIFVSDENGKPKANETVTVFYPCKKNLDETVVFDAKKIKSFENGKAQFLPETPQFACDEKIYFFPDGNFNFDDEKIKTLSVNAPFCVRSNKIKKGCIVYVFDFKENGSVISNSYYLLRDIVNLGVRAGNAPIASPSYLEKTPEELYKATKAITGLSSSFIVAGKITFAEKTAKTDTGKFSCMLQGDIFCIDMETGKVILRTRQTAAGTGQSAYKAEDEARNALAGILSRKIIYGM